MSEVTIVAHDVGPIGGMEVVLSRLISGLAAGGERVTVVARTCAIESSPNIRFCRVRAPARPFVLAYPWFALAGWWALARHRRGIVHATGAVVPGRVDVISVHLLHNAPAARTAVPRASRGSTLFRAHAQLAAILSRCVERRVYRPRHARAFVAVSDGVASELRDAFPAVAERVVTIPNGVDTDLFRPDAEARGHRTALGLPADGLVALFVGSEWARKGLRPAIEAVARAPGWHLAVVGSGDREAYAELARLRGATDQVHFVGVSARVSDYYRAADAFLLPTQYETFSLATYEAAASGLPLLACDVSGIHNLIDDGRNGFFIPLDPSVIAERLALLGSDVALRDAFGRAAREDSLRFGWDAMVAGHCALYAQLRSAR
jgi:UDP-glucose:(heptosyl)LPS alpha-1,3-glucosyltransferase